VPLRASRWSTHERLRPPEQLADPVPRLLNSEAHGRRDPSSATHILVDWIGPPIGGAAQDGAYARRPRDLAFPVP
jgi:hypothetical protein